MTGMVSNSLPGIVSAPGISTRANGLSDTARTSALGFRNSRVTGTNIAVNGGTKRGVSRLQCVASLSPPRAKDLLAEAEERWQRALDSPLEGVPFTYEEFADALSKYDFSFEIGDLVRGVVFKTDFNGALIDIGAKASAYLPLSESCIHKVKNVEEVGLHPGTEEEFMIVQEDDDNGRVIVSLRKLQYDISWERCRQLQADDCPVRGKVLSANRGGLVVRVEGLRGFVPFSQIYSGMNQEDMVEKELPLKFIEVDEERTRLVLSNRKALAATQLGVGIGSVVVGTVQSVKPYGAFVDIGGTSGLLHISQISHDRITTVENVLQPGDKLKVMILSQAFETHGGILLVITMAMRAHRLTGRKEGRKASASLQILQGHVRTGDGRNNYITLDESLVRDPSKILETDTESHSACSSHRVIVAQQLDDDDRASKRVAL